MALSQTQMPAGPAIRACFITPAMSSVLDLLRAASAAVVVLGHAWQVGLLAGPAVVTQLHAHYAVVVFFLVSGLVIGISSAKPGMTLRTYALDRAVRIFPVALLALALSSILFVLRHGQGAVQWDTPDLALTAETILYPLLFLTESPQGVLPVWNPAWWSLSYEVWYYALFGAAVFGRGITRWPVVAAFALIAGPPILLLMPIWLLGVALALAPQLQRVTPLAGAGLLAMASVLVVLVGRGDMDALAWLEHVSPIALVNSLNVIGDSLLGLALFLALIGLRPLLPAGEWPRSSAGRALRWAAGMTFTTYLVHVPLLMGLESFYIRDLTLLPGLAALAAVLCACAALAGLVERRTPRWRRLLDRPRTLVGAPLPA